MATMFDIAALNEASIKTTSLDSITQSHTYLENVSYFSQTVDFLIEYNHEFTEATKALYKGILESGDNQTLINESFTDFTTAVKKIIDKFLAFIKSLFQRFITNLNSMVKSEKYLNKHEKDFNKFSDDAHKFDFSGYKFTIYDNIPETSIESEFLENIDIKFTDIANAISGATDKTAAVKNAEEKLTQQYKALTDKLSGDYYDYLRGKIIGKPDYRISDGEFQGELFAVFRDGDSDKEEITVDKSYVIDCLSRFKNYNKLKTSIEHTRNDIEKEYKNVRQDIDNMVKSEGKDATLTITVGLGTQADTYGNAVSFSTGMTSPAMLNSIETYKKAKVNQVQQMSQIHALAFAAKLDAAKDMFVQDKTVLYKALYKIQGMPKNDKK